MASSKFYVCKHCGNVAVKVYDKGVPLVCCGEPMPELVANTTEAATEKHLPVVSVNGNTVTVAVGEVAHPMLDEHSINFIWLETEKGTQCCQLKPGQEPVAVFAVAEGDKAVAAYEFCNLHGLWKTEL